MRHPRGTLFAALCCTALQPAFHRARAKRRATEDELWADTGGDDLELAGLDDVDSLDRYKRRCAACAQLCVERDIAPSKVCVVAASEAAAVIAFGAGFRRFATDTVARASTLASALPKNATFLARTPRKGPRDGKAAAFLKSRLVFERYRPGAKSREAGKRTKVSASRRKFLEKRDAEKKKSDAAPASRCLASPAEVATALDEGSADGIGGVIGQEGGAAVAAACCSLIACGPLRGGQAVADPEVNATIEEAYTLANKLGLTGTPSYVVGDEVVMGAVGYDQLAEKIKSVRDCGATSC